MPPNLERTRALLQGFDFKTLFIEELGWDRYTTTLDVSIDGQNYTLSAIAEKRGMVVFVCEPFVDRGTADYQTRRKIDRQVAKAHHEHLIIYLGVDRSMQIWQWVKRQAGKPSACREHTYYITQPGDALIQRIRHLAFSLEEEEDLTIVEVGRRARTSFDVEKVTKRFYDRFKTEHGKFLKFLKGIPEEKFQRWYVSVMLNRLMFIYFIQKKGFLGNDTDYLCSRLEQSKAHGRDRYYKSFLCSLFFEGFAKKEDERSPEINQLLGEVPYLDGGLFQEHQVEKLYGKEIQIGDVAFDNLFAFFEQYQWYLDERPLRADNEINPDVLGYIFEKYINQKQMGAYYTKEDITEYISKNTIIPFLFDQAQKKCKIALEGDQSIWQLLKDDPDRYIYDAVKKGVKLPLPEEIAVGIEDVSKRTEWNKPAPREYALPTEIWREVMARWEHYEEVRDKMSNGKINSINDLITYNLDIRQFANDVIENCEGPELLRAFYYTIAGRTPDKSNQEFQPGISVLDPTCGSGAFLFAALNILEPLYEACLDRMQLFLDELDSSGQKHRSDKFSDFLKILGRIEQHPNRRYFILKSIILNNLYGVDIMEEAIEICKLRLFLKLVAQIDKVEDIEPLPDIDFNIQAGNTLVGFASRDEVKEAITTAEAGLKKQTTIMFGEKVDTIKRIEESAEIADRAFKKFQEMQTREGMDEKDFAVAKQELSNRLNVLEDELDRDLASEYGIARNNIPSEKEYENNFTEWRKSHQTFHWFIEFYGIMKNGGFDIIIGNPPYVELPKVTHEYSIRRLQLIKTGNLYSLCAERFASLGKKKGHVGIIVPISSISTPRMMPLMKHLGSNFAPLHISNFAVRPAKLFVGTDMNLTILLGEKNRVERNTEVYSTGYNRWYVKFRPFVFSTLKFSKASFVENLKSIPKIGSNIERKIIQKTLHYEPFTKWCIPSLDSGKIFCHSGGRYFRKCIRSKLSNEYKEIKITKDWEDAVICLLSSSFYYWYWIAISDCYHVTKRDIDNLPVPRTLKEDLLMKNLAGSLLDDLWKNAEKRLRVRADGAQQEEINFYVAKSKTILDEIDKILAKHYGLTEDELDFIINFDVKFRMQNEE